MTTAKLRGKPRSRSEWDDYGASTLRSQARRLFDKFGGARQLAQALQNAGPEYARNTTSVYRWDHPRTLRGSGGLIPTQAWPAIEKAARYAGVILTSDDYNQRSLP